MIIELLGTSGSGKTTILENFIAKVPLNYNCFFCDGWWYSKKTKYLMAIPYLFNLKLIRLIIISLKVLRKRHYGFFRKIKKIRHLVFHFAINKKAKRVSKKGTVVFLSESFTTLIPNLFVGRFEKDLKKFVNILKNDFDRDSYLFIRNDCEKAALYKSTRDNKPISETKQKIIEQFDRLQNFIKYIGCDNKTTYFYYDFSDQSLVLSVQALLNLINKKAFSNVIKK